MVREAPELANEVKAGKVEEVGTGAEFKTVADRATTTGVSVRTQTDADLVVRKAPELANEVKAGEVEEVGTGADFKTVTDRAAARGISVRMEAGKEPGKYTN